MAIEIDVATDGIPTALEVTATATAVNLTALLNKAIEFDKHMGAQHDGYVTTEDITTEDAIRNTER